MQIRRALLLPAVLVLAPAPAHAADKAGGAYPTKPIRMLHGFPPGGNVDVVARIVSQGLAEQFGQQVVVDPRPGAGATVGANIAARAEPDGYTLYTMATGHTVAPGLYAKLPYDAVKDFTAISRLVTYPFLVAIGPTSGMKSVGEIVKAARSQPGKISYGTAGIGTGMHLAALLFESQTGVSMGHVPYKGGNTTGIGVAQGEVPFMFGNLGEVQPHLATGRIRVIAVTSSERWRRMPDVPTLAETVAPNFDVRAWLAVAGPRGVPAPIVKRLNAAARVVLERQDLQARFDDLGVIPAPSSPDEAQKLLAAEAARWLKVMRDAGIQPQQ